MITKMQKMSLKSNDILLVTVGSLAYNVIPEAKDLLDWEEYLRGKFGKKTKIVVIPPTLTVEVLKS